MNVRIESANKNRSQPAGQFIGALGAAIQDAAAPSIHDQLVGQIRFAAMELGIFSNNYVPQNNVSEFNPDPNNSLSLEQLRKVALKMKRRDSFKDLDFKNGFVAPDDYATYIEGKNRTCNMARKDLPVFKDNGIEVVSRTYFDTDWHKRGFEVLGVDVDKILKDAGDRKNISLDDLFATL